MNIYNLLLAQATEHPNVLALIDSNWRWKQGWVRLCQRPTTFAELDRRIQHVAIELRTQGLHSGQAVLVMQPLSLELYVIFGALMRLGCITVFIDPGAGLQHLERCSRLYSLAGAIFSLKAGLLCCLLRSLRQIPLKFGVHWSAPGIHQLGISPLSDLQSWQSDLAQIVPCSPDTPALITFTSGSTGQPKAALRTHGFLLEQYRVLAKYLRPQLGQIEMSILPIFILVNLAAGQTSLIPQGNLRQLGKIKAGPIINQIQQHQPERLLASPEFLKRLIEHGQTRQQTWPSLQKIFTGGAPVMPSILEDLQTVAPNASIGLLYGATEAEPIAHLPIETMTEADRLKTMQGGGLLAGHTVPEIQLRILRQQWGRAITNWTIEDLQHQTLPSDQIGEIVVSGHHVLSRYLQQANDIMTKFTVAGEVWHRTGDAGYQDEQSRLWLVGRCRARIDDHRGILYPLQVECIASQQPGIRRSALISHNSRRVLLVEMETEPQRSLLDKLYRLLKWAHIDEVKVCQTIPVDRRHNAKIDYNKLRERYF